MVFYFIEKDSHTLHYHFELEPTPQTNPLNQTWTKRRPYKLPSHISSLPFLQTIPPFQTIVVLSGKFFYFPLPLSHSFCIWNEELPLHHTTILLSISWVSVHLRSHGTFDGTLIHHTSRFEERFKQQFLKEDGNEFVLHAPHLLMQEEQSHFNHLSSEGSARKFYLHFCAFTISSSCFHGQWGGFFEMFSEFAWYM